MTSAHAPLAPSFAPVWGRCSGAIRASANAPQSWSPETEEGTAAHWVGAEALERCRQPCQVPDCGTWIGRTAPNGVVIDDEITDAVQVYVDHCHGILQHIGWRGSIFIEQLVAMPSIHPQNWGTLDFAAYDFEACRLYLRDYKHGHRLCKAEGNLQLVDYTNGLKEALRIDGQQEQIITADLGVVQPRCYHSPIGPTSNWTLPLSDLRGYFNVLEYQAAEAMGTAPTFTTGEHCRDCPAVGTCSAARMAAYNLADYVRQPFVMDAMDTASLAVEYAILSSAINAARARFEAVEADLQHRITSGDGAGCGLTVESTPGRAQWNVPAHTVLALGQQFGVDAAKPAVITPAQFVKAVAAPMRAAAEQVVKTMAPRPAGALKLVPAADSRTARAFKPQPE